MQIEGTEKLNEIDFLSQLPSITSGIFLIGSPPTLSFNVPESLRICFRKYSNLSAIQRPCHSRRTECPKHECLILVPGAL